MAEIAINDNDIEIMIKGEAEHFFGQVLYTKAVVTLIMEADVHGWEKHNLSHGGNDNALDQFCAAVLVALTRLYADETSLPDDEQAELPPIGKVSMPQRKPVHEILSEMIKYLRDSGYLNDEVASIPSNRQIVSGW